MAELKELTAEEKLKPYSKYYYQPAAAPPPHLAALLEHPMPIDSAKALPIKRLNELLNPGHLEVETGYCVMPDGSGYVAVLNTMPGVTVDMMRWWLAWFVLEDLRYKIWFPRDHFGVKISDEVRNMLLDPNVPRDARSETRTLII